MPKGNPDPSPSTRFGAEKGNPQSPGGWKPENTISYQYRRFMNLKEHELQETVAKEKQNKTWTVAMDIAFRRVVAAQKSLPDVKEITDRTEGKAAQSVDLTSNGETLSNIIYLPPKKSEDYDKTE